MIYGFIFYMAMIGELCCICTICLMIWDAIELRIKRRLRANERFMRWLSNERENSIN